MQKHAIILLAALISLAVILAGCTGSTGSSPASGSAAAGSAGSTTDNLQPSPTDVVPSQNAVTIEVGEKDYLGKIPVTFQGGMGQIHVKKIDITVYCANGDVKTATVMPNKGDSVDVPGTKQTDRVVVYVTFDNGTRLKTNDVLSPYRTR